MLDILTFDEALGRLDKPDKQPHLLMGNGFSRACRDDIFAYASLRDRVDSAELSPEAWQSFDELGTTDFEAVMRALRSAATLSALYNPVAPAIPEQMHRDADQLKDVLIRAIAGSHPEWPGEIPADSYRLCKEFLGHFDKLFTVNYDLLLYWTLMQEEIDPPVRCDDGFRKPADNDEADYVTWEPEHGHSQNVYYLHGALHLFDAGHELQKFTWINTQTRLIDQIRAAMDADLFPLFVTEGDSRSKVERIHHSAYLAKVERSFKEIGNALFVFGHSFGDSDRHILDWIGVNRVRQLFVGLYGDPESAGNRAIIAEANAIEGSRPRRRSLTVHFYDAGSVRVWT